MGVPTNNPTVSSVGLEDHPFHSYTVDEHSFAFLAFLSKVFKVANLGHSGPRVAPKRRMDGKFKVIQSDARLHCNQQHLAAAPDTIPAVISSIRKAVNKVLSSFPDLDMWICDEHR